MAAWRYEISLLVLNKYFTRSLRSPLKYFSTLEEKFRISARPCNILYLSIPLLLLLLLILLLLLLLIKIMIITIILIFFFTFFVVKGSMLLQFSSLRVVIRYGTSP